MTPSKDVKRKTDDAKAATKAVDEANAISQDVEEAIYEAEQLAKARAEVEKMCKLPVANLKQVCDWLNSDDMPLPQNQIRQALKLLLVAETIED